MSDPFFASTKKRKRKDKFTSRIPKATKEKKIVHDEEISGSESDNEKHIGDIESEDSNGFAGESAPDKRVRLAKDYLESLKRDIAETDFDAEDVDRDILAQRLRDDALQTKGKIFLRIASKVDLTTPTSVSFLKRPKASVTSIAIYKDTLFTVSKDALLVKWDISNPRKPIFSASAPGNRDGDAQFQGHSAEILAVEDISFRHNSNQLFSCSSDRTIKSWQLDQMTYVETLFGHQDSVISISAFSNERCVSTGSRDRTARVWKIVDETQLVFRGGGEGSSNRKLEAEIGGSRIFEEGSTDCVCMIDEEHFITGSDNGSIRLWSVARKKAIYTVQLAHGHDIPDQSKHSAELDPPTGNLPPQARWITALGSIPYSDMFISGSWDGFLNLFKISADLKSFERVGRIPVQVKGVINKICVTERGKRGIDGVTIAFAVGSETRTGRWKVVKGAQNGGFLVCLKVNGKECDNRVP
ncbi:putative WD repeat-containing protein [Neolecta irregularis DAH-3]|uniref:Putative WD repeat-containing protein n=1 Tax=Neolecta irregularis (strain DAH-3) TaxID=1198029 RepID=A0A1U7LWZ4_NEOID|nr:putative WD repeat-containing protein [Neolecta irregularis DAH-3]|eukprot:OLL27164.1 putative WD repeat-containing protein [Neolecta irregularis DAH-3]